MTFNKETGPQYSYYYNGKVKTDTRQFYLENELIKEIVFEYDLQGHCKSNITKMYLPNGSLCKSRIRCYDFGRLIRVVHTEFNAQGAVVSVKEELLGKPELRQADKLASGEPVSEIILEFIRNEKIYKSYLAEELLLHLPNLKSLTSRREIEETVKSLINTGIILYEARKPLQLNPGSYT